MEGTTITIPEDLLERLRRVAEARCISVDALVREALEEKVKDYSPERPRGKLQSVGIVASGYTDTARLASEGTPPPPLWR